MGSGGQVSLLGGLTSTTGLSNCIISSAGLTISSSGDLTCTSGILYGLGLTTTGKLTTGSITCSGHATITGSLSGTGVTTLLGSYFTRTYTDNNDYTKDQLNTTFTNYSSKTILDATYQKKLTNSTERVEDYATRFGTLTPTLLKHITGDYI